MRATIAMQYIVLCHQIISREIPSVMQGPILCTAVTTHCFDAVPMFFAPGNQTIICNRELIAAGIDAVALPNLSSAKKNHNGDIFGSQKIQCV